MLFFCFELPARCECTFCLCTSVDPTCSCVQVKCDQYWPARGTETYGMIQVTMLDTVELATYSVRTFALYKVPPRRSRAEPRRRRMYSVCGHICTFLTQATHFQIAFIFLKTIPSFKIDFYVKLILTGRSHSTFSMFSFCAICVRINTNTTTCQQLLLPDPPPFCPTTERLQ